MGGSKLHLFIDGRRAHVQRAAEDKGESENVIDLVGIVGTPRRNNDVRPRGLRIFVSDLGIWIRHGENDRIGRHRANHLLVDCAFHG